MRFKVFYQLPSGERGSVEVRVPSWANKSPAEREVEAEDVVREVYAGEARVNLVEASHV